MSALRALARDDGAVMWRVRADRPHAPSEYVWARGPTDAVEEALRSYPHLAAYERWRVKEVFRRSTELVVVRDQVPGAFRRIDRDAD